MIYVVVRLPRQKFQSGKICEPKAPVYLSLVDPGGVIPCTSTSRTVKFCMRGTEAAQALVYDRIFQEEILESEKEGRDVASLGVAT